MVLCLPVLKDALGSALGAVGSDDKTRNTKSNNKVTWARLWIFCSKRYLGKTKDVSPA